MTTRGEISRRPFPDEREEKHYESVSMQMGRVQLDADWNEAFETLVRARERVVRDIVGKQGSPNEGFRTDMVLILDHMDSKKGWSPLTGWEVDHFEKVEKFEGKGSFKITGNIGLKRDIPLLLKKLSDMRAVLLNGEAAPGGPKLVLWYKVSAVESAKIKITLKGTDAPDISTPDARYQCNGWLALELELSGKDLSAYETLWLNIDANGIVNLGCLALDPGLIPVSEFTRDFYVQGGEGSSENAGRYYVDGLARIKEGFETYRTQKDYPEPASIDSLLFPRLVYLDAWKRTITGVESPDLLEAALGGTDTCTREQLVSQVKVTAAALCGEDLGRALRSEKTGTLTAKLSPKAGQAMCDFRPELDYTGLNNSLYRIEIHNAGHAETATFKWSRNNGADVVAITGFPKPNAVIVPDDRLLCCGDVVELCDDVSELADFAEAEKHGVLATITEIDRGTVGVTITLDIDNVSKTTAPFSGRIKNGGPVRHPKLRKWHGVEKVNAYTEFAADGTLSTELPKELEHGIRLAFSRDYFYHCAFWQFTARVNTRSIEELDHVPPMGPVHHYAPLAVVEKPGNVVSFTSCRKLFPPLNELEAGDIGFDSDSCSFLKHLNVENTQQAIEALCRMKGYDRFVLPGQSIQGAINGLGPEGGSIYLAPGLHLVRRTVLIEERTNITLSGDGPATRVVYIPQEMREPEGVEGLKASIELTSAEIEREKDPVKKKDLAGKLAALKIQLEDTLRAQLRELFRITGSAGITLRNFLMLSFGADSLVAVLDGSRNIAISASEMFNLPFYAGDAEKSPSALLWNKAFPTQTAQMSCIRATDCCELNFEDNIFLGKLGFLQQSVPDISMMPLVNGLRLVRNRFFVQAAVFLIEGTGAVIQDNIVQTIDQDMAALLAKVISMAIELDPGNSCFPESVKTIDQIVAEITEATSQCIPDPPNNSAALGRAFILRNSRIESNLFGGDDGLILVYSEENAIVKNRILSKACGLMLLYSFSTSVCDNIFTGSSAPETPVETTPPQGPAAAPGAAAPPAASPAPSAPGNLLVADSRVNRDKTEAGESRTRLADDYPVIIIHFADRFILTGNQIEGATGFAVKPVSKEEFTGMVTLFSKYAGVSEYSTGVSGSVLLVKRLSELMGLRPAIRLIETILKLYSGGEEIDLVSILIRTWIKNEIPGKNAFLVIMLKLFEALLSLTLISRSVVSRNRFAVERYGIKKIQESAESGNASDISLTLGGVELTDNRIVGAGETAILWKSCALFGNPDLNGVLLSCGYEAILSALKLIQGVFKNIVEQAELKAEATPLNIFIASFAFYTVAQKCPQETTPSTGTGETVPENPYVGVIREIIELIGDLIDQLENDRVRKNISELSRSVDRISMNQIRGKGNGIHTNIANCIIESNRVDLEPGTSAIAELFAMGRQFSVNATLVNYMNSHMESGGLDRPAIASLGNALMNLNPNAVSAAGDMLAEDPQQWKDLGGMLETIIGFVNSTSPITTGLHYPLVKLKDIVSADPPDDMAIKAATDKLIKEAQSHLTGYGIIAEAPGVHVVDNRIEAVMTCGSYTRRAPGGILMTGGESGFVNMLTYFLLLEEIMSLENMNIGGQGTLFRNNSLQWGAGHGLSLSSLPFLFDLSIENNEIQNHGLCGILCDKPMLLASLQNPVMSRNTYNNRSLKNNALGMAETTSVLPALLSSLSYLYKLRITDNELNQCFLNDAFGFGSGPPSQTIDFKENNYSITIIPATILGGLMVRNAAELTCSRNTIRSMGTGRNPWPCSGSVFIDCLNAEYAENKILGNGRETSTAAYLPYCPQGGALFLGPRGRLGLVHNELSNNIGLTALVVANYEIVTLTRYRLGQANITIQAPAYESWSLERLLVQANDFDIDDSNLSGWPKIYMGNRDNVDSLKTSNFSQNTVEVPVTARGYAVELVADWLLFNGNAMRGRTESANVHLISNKGIGTGNILDRRPDQTGVYITEDQNNEHNRWQ